MSGIALRRIATLISDCPAMGARPYVALEHVGSGTGQLISQELSERDSAEAAVAVEPGDVLFGKLRPYLGKSWLVDRPVYASTELLALRPNPDIDSRWLAYVCVSRPLVEWAVATSDGTKMPRTSWERLGTVPIEVPAIAIQCEIADFLDVETARIDALLTRKRRLLALLSMRRYAAIGEALHAAGRDFLPLRRLVASFVDYRGATPAKAESGVPLVTATNVSDGEIDLSLGEQFVSDATYAEWMRRGFPEIGDVLLTTEAPLGEVAMIRDPRVAIAQRIILLKPDRERVLPEFLYISLRSPVVQADLLSRASGSTVWGIRADRLRDVRVHITSHREQQHVVDVAQRAEERYFGARVLLERQIELLREHRQALITAAVTGQLDVAKAAA